MTPTHPISRGCQLVEQVEAQWQSSAWRDVHVVVALSGGPDSMALLVTLLRIARRSPGAGRIFAAHVNHRLRPEATVEQRWIEAECERLKVELLCENGPVVPTARRDGDGIEAAARRVRYRLLTEMAESVGARFVAMGHTYDDQIETVLFRMLRGTGVRGLVGMPFSRALTPSVTLVRPFLSVRRSTIQSALDELGQAVICDASNADLQFRRNSIRLELLPWLRDHLNPDVDDAIWRLAEQAAQLNGLVESIASAALARCQLDVRPGKGFSVDAASLAGESDYLVCESLRLAWRQCELPEQAMTYAHWRRLTRVAICRQDDASIALPGKMLASRTGGRLSVSTQTS